MKTIFPLGCVVLCTFVSSALSFDELAVYKAEDVVESGGSMTWNDTGGIYPLELKDATGVSIGDKPDVGDDTKSVVFSGEQIHPFRSGGDLEVPKSALKVSLLFKPSADAASANQTLIRHVNWEIRYSPESEKISFIVWHDASGAYSGVSAPITAGVWHRVVATLEQGVLGLDIDGETVTKDAKGALAADRQQGGIIIGASANSRTAGGEFRPLCGALAEIKIFLE